MLFALALAFPRSAILMDSTLGTNIERMFQGEANVEPEETRFRGCGGSPKGD
jgi:hypothetical protein